eukprot:525063_1
MAGINMEHRLKKFVQRCYTLAVCVVVVLHSLPVGVLGATSDLPATVWVRWQYEITYVSAASKLTKRLEGGSTSLVPPVGGWKFVEVKRAYAVKKLLELLKLYHSPAVDESASSLAFLVSKTSTDPHRSLIYKYSKEASLRGHGPTGDCRNVSSRVCPKFLKEVEKEYWQSGKDASNGQSWSTSSDRKVFVKWNYVPYVDASKSTDGDQSPDFGPDQSASVSRAEAVEWLLYLFKGYYSRGVGKTLSSVTFQVSSNEYDITLIYSFTGVTAKIGGKTARGSCGNDEKDCRAFMDEVFLKYHQWENVERKRITPSTDLPRWLRKKSKKAKATAASNGSISSAASSGPDASDSATKTSPDGTTSNRSTSHGSADTNSSVGLKLQAAAP